MPLVHTSGVSVQALGLGSLDANNQKRTLHIHTKQGELQFKALAQNTLCSRAMITNTFGILSSRRRERRGATALREPESREEAREQRAFEVASHLMYVVHLWLSLHPSYSIFKHVKKRLSIPHPVQAWLERIAVVAHVAERVELPESSCSMQHASARGRVMHCQSSFESKR